MDKFDIILKPSIEKDFRKIPDAVVSKIFQKIEALQQTPFPSGSRKLSGTENLYRIRVGDYRTIYSIDYKSKQITIQYIRHRKDAYKDL